MCVCDLFGQAVLSFARQHPRLDPTKIVPFGRSLGGAVAIALAKRRPDEVGGSEANMLLYYVVFK